MLITPVSKVTDHPPPTFAIKWEYLHNKQRWIVHQRIKVVLNPAYVPFYSTNSRTLYSWLNRWLLYNCGLKTVPAYTTPSKFNQRRAIIKFNTVVKVFHYSWYNNTLSTKKNTIFTGGNSTFILFLRQTRETPFFFYWNLLTHLDINHFSYVWRGWLYVVNNNVNIIFLFVRWCSLCLVQWLKLQEHSVCYMLRN